MSTLTQSSFVRATDLKPSAATVLPEMIGATDQILLPLGDGMPMIMGSVEELKVVFAECLLRVHDARVITLEPAPTFTEGIDQVETPTLAERRQALRLRNEGMAKAEQLEVERTSLGLA